MPSRGLLLAVLFLPLPLFSGLFSGCVCSGGHRTPPEAARDFGDAGPFTPLGDGLPPAYLALARHTIEQSGQAAVSLAVAPPPPPPAPGRRVFLLFYPRGPRGGGEPLAATANAATLADAVRGAALALAPKIPLGAAASGRLELDVPTVLE